MLVAKMTGKDHSGNDVQVSLHSVAEISDMDYNLFYEGNGPVNIRWGASFSYASTAEMSSFPGGGSNQLDNPRFVDRIGHDVAFDGGIIFEHGAIGELLAA